MYQRTNIDFSRHKLKVTKFDGVLIHEFKRPETNNCMLVFINTCGVMTVTGDFGNWVFCREFHPSGDREESVNPGYWDEKLEIASKQKAKQFDSEETLRVINEFERTFFESYRREMTDEEIIWVELLKSNIDDEFQYIYVAYRESPGSIDYEDIPFGTKRHFWLEAVYDGFDAICDFIKKENNE
jgi:hypothetical protein